MYAETEQGMWDPVIGPKSEPVLFPVAATNKETDDLFNKYQIEMGKAIIQTYINLRHKRVRLEYGLASEKIFTSWMLFIADFCKALRSHFGAKFT